jgi:hypothetical protein
MSLEVGIYWRRGIDPTDSFGVSLRLSVRENQIFHNPLEPSTPWLTDRGRLFDGMFEKSSSSDLTIGKFFLTRSRIYVFYGSFKLTAKKRFFVFACFWKFKYRNIEYVIPFRAKLLCYKIKKKNHSIPNDLESQYQLMNRHKTKITYVNFRYFYKHKHQTWRL